MKFFHLILLCIVKCSVSENVTEQEAENIIDTTENQKCTPVPAKVVKLDLHVHNDITKLLWMLLEEAECIKEYKISFNVSKDNAYVTTTKNNYFEISQNLYCVQVRVEAVDNNNQTGEAAVILKPGPVENLLTEVTDNSITLRWNPPQYSACVHDYLVQLDHLDLQYETPNEEIKIPFLLSCETYKVNVLARTVNRGFGEATSRNLTILEPKDINQVEDLSANNKNDIVTVHWKAPTTAILCNITYTLNVYIDNEVIYSENTTKNYHEINSISWFRCVQYKITVTPVVRSSIGKPAETYIELLEDLGQIRNLTVHSEKDSITINWKPPENGEVCDVIYVLQINKGEDVVYTAKMNEDYHQIVSTSSWQGCTRYTVLVIPFLNTSPGQSAETTFEIIKEIGPVENLQSNLMDRSIGISWDYPANKECVHDYVIHLDELEYHSPNQTYTFNDLIPCSTYNIHVAARTQNYTIGPDTYKYLTTLAPQEIGPVENLTTIIENGVVTLKWEAPDDAKYCNVHYVLQLPNDNTGIYTYKKYHEISFTSWIGCMNYTIAVKAMINSVFGELTTTNVNILKVTNPPICNVKLVQETSALLECRLNSSEVNMCTPREVVVNCIASVYTNYGVWIKWNGSGRRTIKNDLNQPIQIQINDLSEFTNYSCQGVVINVAGGSLPSKMIELQTTEGVPSAPIINTIIPTNKTLDITWIMPERIPGILQKYRLTIESKGSLYFIPEECTFRGNHTYTYEINPLSNEFTFLEAFPGGKYLVHMEAATRKGYGAKSKTEEIRTYSGIPDEPRNVNFMVKKTDAKEYNASVDVTWSYPCYTNGDITHFEVNILGFPYVDFSKINHTEKQIIPINTRVTKLDYGYTIQDVRAAFNYTVYIRAIRRQDVDSNEASFTFFSPESYPEMPILKPILERTKKSFKIEWDEPSEKNGVLQNYSIQIISLGPLYYIPNDRECYENEQTKLYTVSPHETSFMYEFAKPHHSYKVLLKAATKIGTSDMCELITDTLQEEPQEVRNCTMNLISLQHEEYQASTKLTFKHPCNTYGQFKWITISLLGNRVSYLTHHEEFNLVNIQDEYELTLSNLRPEHHYVLTIHVKTEKFTSKLTRIEFLSPAGVPPQNESLPSPTPLGPNLANFTLDRNLFDSKYGEILYYALIISVVDHEEQSQYGFWNGDYDSWPVLVRNFSDDKIMQPYQATPMFWNPFTDDNVTAYEIVLGDTSYSEANKQLQSGTSYAFKVRGFTKHGYRDTPIVVFQTPEPANVPAIMGILFGILGTVLLIGCVCVLYRKRREWAVEKEAIKAIPLTPIPVSIKQFPLHYNELKSNNDKLKQEFLALNNKSNELTLTSSDGILPINKKKNRYTNIIPYDQTRVKLLEVEDCASNSDYINASYIQGYSGNTEYIATQGPLEHTCADFWRMVMQENSSLIVMVAQFVEQNKEKCYKYFPNNHENMELEYGIGIRCCTELDFKTHVIRTLLVQKDLKQWTVTHLQFTDWPDFGCPKGTEVTIEFCNLMREHAERNPDPIIIHCSAGVGRTGTLIALDILLQVMNNSRDVDIFGTVLNLRRDRKCLVQTDKQYLYIHNCINDIIKNPTPIQCDISKEPIYENLEDVKKLYSNNDVSESKF